MQMRDILFRAFVAKSLKYITNGSALPQNCSNEILGHQPALQRNNSQQNLTQLHIVKLQGIFHFLKKLALVLCNEMVSHKLRERVNQLIQ